jgi:cephalosporin hydroxylase
MISDINTLVEDEVRLEIFQPFIDKTVGGEVIVEVGTFVGGNLCRVGDMVRKSGKNIKLYGIDNFHFANISTQAIQNVNLKFGDYDTRQDSFYDQLIKNIKDSDLQSYIEIIDSDSIEAAAKFEDESIDLLFLDGSHSYPYTGEELKVWLPKVKIGGIVSGHDWPAGGIQQAVKENISKPVQVVSSNGAYWVYK